MQHEYDVIIIGGSYAGLSAAMTLGRSVKQVLVIDNGKPCNAQTPHSHNFLTQDGKTPQEIAEVAKAQVVKYDTVTFVDDTAIKGSKTSNGFEIATENNGSFKGKKLIFASGVKDEMPAIEGFAECWGITVIHCPYCHGYEVRNQTTGIFANGEMAYEFSKLIWNWSKDLTIFTHGKSTLTEAQTTELKSLNINIVEKEIVKIVHQNGKIEELVFADHSVQRLDALYAKIPFTQKTTIPETLGCEFIESGHIKIDAFQKTSVDGVFACGDNTTMMRSVASAVYNGNMAGVMAGKELISEDLHS
ncbi:MAG: NAD(P)/FAD-dependent oxidoreductase [Pedobacter sp.]|nr:MAG: NAD(P)/FAD-dependent oxidoreductase [Pedobacter sp.]